MSLPPALVIMLILGLGGAVGMDLFGVVRTSADLDTSRVHSVWNVPRRSFKQRAEKLPRDWPVGVAVLAKNSSVHCTAVERYTLHDKP